MFFTILFVFGCKESAFFSNSRRKCEIPLKLTIAKGIAFREETLQWGLQFISIWCYRLILLQTYISIQVLCCLSIALLHAYSMGVLLSLNLYSIFVPYFDLYFFIIVVAVSLSFGFLRCKGMAVLSDTKHQAMPYSAKTFPERLPQMLHIWVFQKTFYRIVWCSDFWNLHFLMHVKRLYDDEMTE